MDLLSPLTPGKAAAAQQFNDDNAKVDGYEVFFLGGDIALSGEDRWQMQESREVMEAEKLNNMIPPMPEVRLMATGTGYNPA